MSSKRTRGGTAIKRPSTSIKTLRLIHFYNSDGFVHYVSEVLKGADCRVADVVRSPADLNKETVGILVESADPVAFERIQRPGPHQVGFAEEAVRVALALPTWINNIWMNSPMRDSAIWTGERSQPPGVIALAAGHDPAEVVLVPGGLKARWRADWERRRKAWEKDRLILPLGVAV